MKSVKNCYMGLVLTGILSACSSSSDSGGSDDPATTPTAPTSSAVVITPANASKVSAEAYDSVVETRFLGIGNVDTDVIIGAVVSSDDTGFDLITFTRQQLARLADLQGQVAANMVVAPVIPATTVPCDLGGTFVISGEQVDFDTVSSGDTIILDFNSCNNGVTLVSGKYTMQINDLFPDSNADIIGFDITLTLENFSVTESGVTSTGTGDITLAIPNVNSSEVEATMSGNSLALTEGNETTTLRDFSIVEIYDEATDAYSTDSSGMLESTTIGGVVTFDTTVAFQSVGDGLPFEGTALISGANGSQTRMIALGSDSVRLEIDSDGDGTFEVTTDTTWSEL